MPDGSKRKETAGDEDQQGRGPFDQAVFTRQKAETEGIGNEHQRHQHGEHPAGDTKPKLTAGRQPQLRRAQPGGIAGKALNRRE
ncbi:hypothetical protein D3C87_1735500 [compost metagenome]